MRFKYIEVARWPRECKILLERKERIVFLCSIRKLDRIYGTKWKAARSFSFSHGLRKYLNLPGMMPWQWSRGGDGTLRDRSGHVLRLRAMLRFCHSFYARVCLIQRKHPSYRWQAPWDSLTLLVDLSANRTGRRKHPTSVFGTGSVGWEGCGRRPGSDAGCSAFVILAHGLEVKLNLLYNLSTSKSGEVSPFHLHLIISCSPGFRDLKSKINNTDINFISI